MLKGLFVFKVASPLSARRRIVRGAAGILFAVCALAGEARAGWWEKSVGEKEKPAPASAEAAAPHPETKAAAPDPKAPVIPVAQPIRQKVTEYIELTGNAASTNTVSLIARVEGYLEKIHFQDGQIVKKGDLLFTIQQEQYKAQLAQSEAQAQAQAAALAYAEIMIRRYEALARKGAAAQVVVDFWHFHAQKAAAELASAQAQIEIGKLNLGYTEVRAPFDGQMGKHLVDPGNTVGGAGHTATLAEILQLDPIYVVANLSERELERVRKALGQRRLTLAQLHETPVDVGLEAGQDYPYHGFIQYVAPAIDPKTGTMLVRGLLKNPDRRLLPGYFVRIRLPAGRVIADALLVPNRAVQTDQGGRFLTVVGPDDVLAKRYVELGDLEGDLRVILSGLKADERVVVGDLWRANPGTRITPRLTTLDRSEGAQP